MAYSPERKAAVLARMLSPGGISLRQLSQQEGISRSTLRRWRGEAKADKIVIDTEARVEDAMSAPAEGCTPPSSLFVSAHMRALKAAWRCAMLSVTVIILGLTALFGYVWLDLNSKGLLKIPGREPGIMVLASDGTILALEGAFHGDEVRLSALPDHIPNALIAIEDRRFRKHMGFDTVGLLRAALANYRAGRIVQGGSTLTQQLVKNVFLTPDRTMSRKLQEIVLAVWLELNFSKDDILEMYLNRVYFGAGAVGIEKAAQTYFAKPATELSIAEAAMLAGVLRAPRNYNPLGSRVAAQQRANLVINSMVEAGFISPAEGREATDKPAVARPSDNKSVAFRYIVDWVMEEVATLVPVYDQSIVIETTIDPHMQSVAGSSLARHLSLTGSKLRATQGALVLMNSEGGVHAMVGGLSYSDSQFNRATKARRQPGSSFKPFVYLAALEQGYGPERIEIDEPIKVGSWEPENYGQEFRGAVTLETALALSLNTIAVKLMTSVGANKVAATARRLGIRSQLNAIPSLALGTSEVTLLEVTGAFASFANGGHTVRPFAVKRVLTRDGRVLYERRGEAAVQDISPYGVAGINGMLRAVVSRGTGKRAQFGGFDIAGKTGTSQDYRDAWFVGYTADLVAGVWIGNDDNTPTARVTGGSLPADIWRDVMSVAHLNLPPKPLPGLAGPEDLRDAMALELGDEEAAFALAGRQVGQEGLAAGRLTTGSAGIQERPMAQRQSNSDLRRIGRSTNPVVKQRLSRTERKRSSLVALDGMQRSFRATADSSEFLGRASPGRQEAHEQRRLDKPKKSARQKSGKTRKCKRRALFSLRCEKLAARER